MGCNPAASPRIVPDPGTLEGLEGHFFAAFTAQIAPSLCFVSHLWRQAGTVSSARSPHAELAFAFGQRRSKTPAAERPAARGIMTPFQRT
jgi:hypothetical protein